MNWPLHLLISVKAVDRDQRIPLYHYCQSLQARIYTGLLVFLQRNGDSSEESSACCAFFQARFLTCVLDYSLEPFDCYTTLKVNEIIIIIIYIGASIS